MVPDVDLVDPGDVRAGCLSRDYAHFLGMAGSIKDLAKGQMFFLLCPYRKCPASSKLHFGGVLEDIFLKLTTYNSDKCRKCTFYTFSPTFLKSFPGMGLTNYSFPQILITLCSFPRWKETESVFCAEFPITFQQCD